MEEKRRPEDMLIIAADFPPGAERWQGVKKEVLKLAARLYGTEVYIKVNSVLRACGYELISDLHALGLKVGADLKLVDIPETMEIDAALLAEYKPEFVTVMCNASVEGMARVKNKLKDAGTEVLGVTVLTSLDEEECQGVYGCSTKAGVVRFARLAKLAGLDGLILSPKEVGVIRERKELQALSLNTPGIRPSWTFVEGDDQKRTDSPANAIKSGAKRVVIGRPITRAGDPRDAVKQTLDEIQAALEIIK